MTPGTPSPDPLLGAWATLGEPRLTNELARSGLGWVGLDAQHGHFDDRSLRDTLGHRSADAAPMLVRVAANDAALIGRRSTRARTASSSPSSAAWPTPKRPWRQPATRRTVPAAGVRSRAAGRCTVPAPTADITTSHCAR